MTGLYVAAGAVAILLVVIAWLVVEARSAARHEQEARQAMSEVQDAEKAAEIQAQPVPRGRALLERLRNRSGG